jgi:tetratricopeptide (TPR) repeat protein
MAKIWFDIANWRAIMSAMRISYIRALAGLALIISVSGQWSEAFSADKAQSDVQQTFQTQKQNLDTLFASLKKTRDPDEAVEIASMIALESRDSGSATINLLLQWSAEAVKQNRLPAALEFLDQAVVLKPDFAESWNQRAILHYRMKNLRKAMADITVVLKLEPRHFGALLAMASILEERGMDEQAIKALESSLAVYPADRDAQTRLNALSDKRDGNRT